MTLFIVPTPIGNLEDITSRAVRVLRESSVVFCEDTRRTRILMSHLGLSTPLERYNEDDDRSVERVLDRLRLGHSVALVSDGGCPGISDPGRRVVAAARRERLAVEALPGPSAVAAAVAGSGLPGDRFVFLGFLSRTTSKRRRALEEAKALGRTIVVYESPFRVLELLDDATAALGSEAQCVAARELSKTHEEWLTGTPSKVREALASRPEILGEFVVMFHPDSERAHA